MYNSQNLPLSKKKVIKKSMPNFIAIAILGIFISVFTLIICVGINFSAIATLFIILIIWLLLIIFFAIPTYIYQYYYWKLYYYNFEENSAEIKKGVIKQATGIVNYARIQNIYVDQDLFDRIYGLYDIHYETAGETSRFYSHVDGLEKENADKLLEFIKNKAHGMPIDNAANNINQVNIQNLDEDDKYKNIVYTRNNLNVSKKIVYKGIISNLLSLILPFLIFFFIILGRVEDENLKIDWFPYLVIFYFFITPAFSIIYSILWYKNFEFKFDSKIGFIKTKVLSQKMTYIYYDRIQNINMSQSFIDRILGIYTVTVETAGERSNIVVHQNYNYMFSGMTVPGLNKENAEGLKDFLMDRAKKYRQTL